MSSLPMLVAPLNDFRSADNLAFGVKQYKNWHIPCGCKSVVLPKTLSPEGVVFNEVTRKINRLNA